jgi:hypothetical protein
MRWWQALPSTE